MLVHSHRPLLAFSCAATFVFAFVFVFVFVCVFVFVLVFADSSGESKVLVHSHRPLLAFSCGASFAPAAPLESAAAAVPQVSQLVCCSSSSLSDWKLHISDDLMTTFYLSAVTCLPVSVPHSAPVILVI